MVNYKFLRLNGSTKTVLNLNAPPCAITDVGFTIMGA